MAPTELTRSLRDSEVVVAAYRVENLLRRRSAEDAVYEAVHVEDGAGVELRVMANRDREFRRRFEGEAALLAGLDHPNLPTVQDFGEADGRLYLATAPHTGSSLADSSRRGGLPPLRAVRLFGSIADALDASHVKGLVHGDMRLESMIVVERHVEHPYLVDFALGGPRADGGPAGETPADDVRALAFALFECLTGEPPERDGGPLPRLRERREDLPPELDELLADAMSTSATRRSAGELIGDAARALMAAPPRAPEPPAARPDVVFPAVPDVVERPAEPEVQAPPPAEAEPVPVEEAEAPPVEEAETAPLEEAEAPPVEEPEPAPLEKAEAPPVEEAEPAPVEEPEPTPVEPEPAFTTAAPPRQAPPPTPAPPATRRLRPRAPVLLGTLAVVLAAGAAGLLVGRQAEDDGAPVLGSGDAVRISQPADWTEASEGYSVPGVPLESSVSVAGPDGSPALLAGRLPGLRGSVYPAAVAAGIDRSPPRPQAVRLARYEALRFRGLAGRGQSRLTLFVAPTSAGTLAAVCLPGAPVRECEGAAASLELPGASASGLGDGARFARRLDGVLRTLDRRRSALSGRLRRADISRAQAAAAGELARAHRSARRSIARLEATPAAAEASRRLARSLSTIEGAYRRLSRAAGRRDRPAFAAAQRAVRRGEARLRTLLRGL